MGSHRHAFPTHYNSHASQLVDVYDSDYTCVLSVPRRFIDHLPDTAHGISRLVLCRNYNASGSEHSCAKGHQCKFVHARLDHTVKSQSIHVNYAWRSLSDVKYPTLRPGKTLCIAAPNNRAPPTPVASEMILVTRGSQRARGDVQHCAHYYFNRMCNRGEQCSFIHTVYIDPNAEEFEKAPSPAAYLHRMQSGGTSCESSCCLSDVENVDGALTPREADEPSPYAAAVNEAMQQPSTQQAPHPPRPPARYRHNPYSVAQTVVVQC